MTLSEFQALKYKPARQWLRAQGHRIGDSVSRAQLNEIFSIAHTDGTEPVPTPPQPAPRPVSTQPVPTEPKPQTIMNTLNTVPTAPLAPINDPAQMLATALTQMLTPKASPLDEGRVIELIQTHSQGPRSLNIQVAERPAIDSTPQHYKFPLLLTCLANGIHVMLVGEAGSGKTTGAAHSAKALGVPFYAQSFCATTSKADLQGYMNATGEYVQTNFRRSFESGGIFCADEFDAGNPNTNAVINQALANELAGFPDGMVPRHDTFTVVACANTYGKGANARYVGRNKLDAATLDRFAVIQWDVDEALEASFIGIQQPQQELDLAEGGILEPTDWLDLCRSVRATAGRIGAELIVSPRAVQAGAKLSAAGVGKSHLVEMFIYRGADQLTREKLAPALN